MLMLQFFRYCLIAALLFTINHSYASDVPTQKMNAEELSHASSALVFAEKENWVDARYHAQATHNSVALLLVSWLQYRTKDSGASFEDITRFITMHPEWPDIALLQQRAEEAITLSTSPYAITHWFSSHPPLTGDGLKAWALAKTAFKKQGNSYYAQEESTSLLRQAWVRGNFGTKEEEEFLAQYSSILRSTDYNDRIDQLLWQGRTSQATRILGNIDKGHQQLFMARIAFITNNKKAETLLASIPAKLRSDAGLLYDRILWNIRQGNSDRAEALFRFIPHSPPYPSKWWDIKNNRIRTLLKEKKYAEAYRLSTHHGQKEGEGFAEAEWLSGWIALRFLHKPDEAYKHFYTLYQGVKFPVSLSRGAYWSGRAAAQNGNNDIAVKWYKVAAQYPDNFYGQLALLKLYKNQKLLLPASPVVTAKDTSYYAQSTLVSAAAIAAKSARYDLVSKLLKSAINNAKTPGEIRLITEFGAQIRQKHIALEAAKYAAKNGTSIIPMCYPVFEKMPESPLEEALTLAIIRQESSFNTNAESPAGAAGLMQLMPATAQGMAKELRTPYAAHMLKSDQHYNIRLGSHYLNKLIYNFSGSYVLAIASYNGGQGNVRKWLKEYGDPRNATSLDEVIDWVEMIPFSETRNYVQRVLEGVQVYRQLLAPASPTSTVRLEKDLLHNVP